MYHIIRMFHGKAFVASYFRQPSRTAGTTKSQGVAFIQGQQEMSRALPDSQVNMAKMALSKN
jgi:hypothetical protein